MNKKCPNPTNNIKCKKMMLNQSQLCISCSNVSRTIYEFKDTYKRECPICHTMIYYNWKQDYYSAIKNNSKCYKCVGVDNGKNLRGKNRPEHSLFMKGHNPMKNVTGSNHPFFGKTLEKIWDDNSKVKQFKERMSNNNPAQRIEIRQKISEFAKNNLQNPFKQCGEMSVRIKSILKEQNILYSDYINNKNEFGVYKNKVWYLTRKQPLHLLENYNKPRHRAGTNGAYQLDHIVSIKYGFDNNISIEEIAKIENLRFITWEENLKKGAYCEEKS